MFKLRTRTQCHVTCTCNIFYKSRVVAYLYGDFLRRRYGCCVYVYDIISYLFMIFFGRGGRAVGGRYRYIYTVYNCVWRELGVTRRRQVTGGVLYFSPPRPKIVILSPLIACRWPLIVSVLLCNYNVIEKRKKT